MVTEKQVTDFCEALSEQPELTRGCLYDDGSFEFFPKDGNYNAEGKEVIYILSKRYGDTADSLNHRFYAR